MSEAVKVALAGIAGYGDSYLEALLPRQESLGARIVGVVDPRPQRCRWLKELSDGNIPVHHDLESLFEKQKIDLMLIVTPIHLHASQTCFALKRGANVLCEKPVAGTLADAFRMAEAQAAGADAQGSAADAPFAAIGYQWSFSAAVQALKRDVLDGTLGRPICLRSLVFFPRPVSYFGRNDWAGRMYTEDGQGVFDSPVNNATAHYLHNMFYVLGATRETSAIPASVQAELYRANDIENYDTAALRCRTTDGAEILFYTTHAVGERRGPKLRYEFERATVEFDAMGSGQFVAKFRDGTLKHYGHPNLDRHEKVWQAIDAVRTRDPLACGIPAAMSHALCVAAAQESASFISEFPDRLRKIVPLEGEPMVVVDKLGQQFLDCYDRAVLPSEHPDVCWARAGNTIELGTAIATSNGRKKANDHGPVEVTLHAQARKTASETTPLT